MTLLEIQVLLQSVSSLAIAGSFIYAGIQFRNHRRAAYVANFTRLVELQMQLRRMRVDDPSLAHVYKHDVQGLRTDREVREYFMNLMQLSVFEIVWFGHKHGQIPEDYYRSWLDRMRAIESEDSFRAMMANPAMKILHDEFQALIARLMREQDERRRQGAPTGA